MLIELRNKWLFLFCSNSETSKIGHLLLLGSLVLGVHFFDRVWVSTGWTLSSPLSLSLILAVLLRDLAFDGNSVSGVERRRSLCLMQRLL